ncbi:MAG: cell surface protein SprA [Bacteroidota bacterium]|nr:cell surface protein SprA [Bacteroidota bacterium]
MKKNLKYLLHFLLIFVFAGKISASEIQESVLKFSIPQSQNDTTPDNDTIEIQDVDLPYEFDGESNNPNENQDNSPLYGSNPSNIQTKVVFDPKTGSYVFRKVLGDSTDIETPYSMSMEDYVNYDFEKGMQEYWRQRYKNSSFETQSSLIPKLEVGGEAFDRIFGSNTIDIKPQGSAELRFGLNISTVKNPSLPVKMQRQTIFDFEEKIQMNVVGQIGDKMRLNVQYDTEAAFDFENSVKIEYTGHEDEIIQKIEAGNVSLPLTGSLIQGSQSLFGFKTELKFGRLTMTTIFSQQKGETSTITVEGGAQLQEYEIDADEYEANKHFFLAHYFKENYDRALANLPIINSGINITRIEVWVTNTTGNFENARNIIAFPDLAESNSNDIQSDYANTFMEITQIPSDSVNDLLNIEDIPDVRDINQASSALTSIGMRGGVDFEKIESARMLNNTEYTYNSQLGYISLNSRLSSDQVLAVAFEYTMNGKTYRVGEFANSGISAPDALILKTIKGTSLTPKLKTWDLMMKNIYAIGAYQVNNEDFVLDVMYRNDKTGTAINYIPAGEIDSKILLRVMNLDNLNTQLDPYPDGQFDFINNITIIPQNGRIIFPVREPFGSHLRDEIIGGVMDNEEIAEQYVFQELYDSTQSTARQIAEKNKFYLTGHYKSSSGSEISLNAINIPEGSIVVSAGGMQLQENVDYTVDYNLGRVKIINEGILESGTPINISLESNSLFNIQTKTLVGTHLNYEISKDFNLGATILNLTERPLTQKVSFGDDPISNTIWGVNGSYRSELPWLTKAVDWLPLIETKEKSSVTITGEFAHLIPGISKAIEDGGSAYIDDFEGSETSMDIKSFHAWNIASTPSGQEILFPGGDKMNNLIYGYNRAKLAWYVIDPLFHRSNSPVSLEQQSSHYVREVQEKEIFPNKDSETGTIPTTLAVLNLAYYPNLKGPYNYEINGLNTDGTLSFPQKRWGGIMRSLNTNDFEEANIEYIEFWMMDPFAEDETNQGGDLYFNLGNISEDILKDGRKSFENGLPTPTTDNPVDTTIWGLVPLIQSLTNAFDNEPESREAQDVGLDGLSDELERSFFSTGGMHSYLDSLENTFGSNSPAYLNAFEDPSSDNYKYFRGDDLDEQELGISDRYMNYNGLDGNSPVTDNAAYSSSARTVPDVEDINRDNTLSENEAYFQYRISIRPEDLEVGKNFITDKTDYTAQFSNDEQSKITWYQFKIPISSYDKKVGTIDDFKSIRFMRLFLTNFTDPTIIRFGTMDLVRSEWRKYDNSFIQPGEYIPDEIAQTPFEVTAVNIEENAYKEPVNYVLPPDIDRVTDPTNPQLRQLNEQAMVLKVTELVDGDARAVYKNINMDIRKYRKLKMYVHAEEITGYPIDDDELRLFIRLGSDYQNNYYEYDIPLKLTPYGSYNNDVYEDRVIVWPIENNVELDFDLLQLVKQNRNDEMRGTGSGVTLTRLYSLADGDRNISIMGNPNLSNVKTIMIGVRNPKKQTANDYDDGLPKSTEIWVNELRLTDFDQKGGWAANARMTTRLADFGSVTVTGETSKPGFGAINQKVNERQKEEINSYNITSNFELGKFFPQKAGVRIPMYVGYSESVSNPEYNPLDPDIPFKVALNDPNRSAEEKDSLRYIAQDYTQRKSINFTNVKVNKMKGKPQVYDLANWSASYSYNETFRRNVNTQFNTNKDISGSLAYNYNATPKNVQPFKSVKFFNNPAFKLLQDFNFYYLPSQLSFRTNLVRTYNETQLRNVSNPYVQIPLNINKNFFWVRQYDFKYNFSRSLKFDFSASNNARIDEPQGRMWEDDPFYQQKRDTIWDNLREFGRNTHYNHRFNVNYKIPINKFPLLKWISANARYNGTYDWIASPIIAEDSINLGNTIQNSNTVSLSTQFNMLTLYNSVNYLKDVNQKYKGRSRRNKKPKKETVTYEEEDVRLRKDKRKRIVHKLKTEEITIQATAADGKIIEGELEIVNDKTVYFIPSEDSDKALVKVTGVREEKESIAKIIFDNTLALAMSTKNINVSYSGTNGTQLPGFLPESEILGMTNYQGTQGPNIPFVLGWQDRDFAHWASDNQMLTRDSMLNQPYTMSENETWTIRASLEPVRRMRVDLNINRTYTENISEYYNWTVENPISGAGRWTVNSQMRTGNFSMTTITWGTAFEPISKDGNYESDAFNTFNDARLTIATRLAQQHPNYHPSNVDEDGFPVGYGKLSQSVMIPAFLAAYSGRDAKQISLDPFPSLANVLPNWRLTYDGLAQIPFLKQYLRTANITHVYRSTYNVGGFTSRLADMWNPQDGFNYITDPNGNFYSELEIGSISITEQFSPFIGIDLNWTNSLITKIEFKKSRNLNMSFANNQLTEMRTNEYVIGGGYRIQDVEIQIGGKGGRKRTFKSDLNLRLDLSIRNNLTIIRKLEEGVNQPTAGNSMITIKTSADYVLSDRFNLRIFYDHIITNPEVSSSFPTRNIDFGVSIRFMLAS